MRQIRGILRTCIGPNYSQGWTGNETISHGSFVDSTEESVPPFVAARNSSSYVERYISRKLHQISSVSDENKNSTSPQLGRFVRWIDDDRRIPIDACIGNRLPGQIQWIFSVQR